MFLIIPHIVEIRENALSIGLLGEKMSDKSILVNIWPLEAGNEVEYEYSGAPLFNEFVNAPFERRIEVI